VASFVIPALLAGTFLANVCPAQDAREPSGRKRGLFLSLAFSQDGALLAAGGDSVRVYDVESAEIVARWNSPPMIRAIGFSPIENSVLVEAGDNGALRFRRVSEKEPFRLVQAHAGRIANLVLASDGKRGVSTATLQTGGAPIAEFRLWNAETGEILRKFDWDEGLFTYATFSHDGRAIALAKSSRRKEPFNVVEIYSVDSWELARTIFISGYAATVSFRPDGKELMVAGNELVGDFSVGRLSRVEGTARIAFAVAEPGDDRRLYMAEYMPAGGTFVIATNDQSRDALGRVVPANAKIQMCETKSGKPIWSRTSEDDRSELTAIAVSRDGKRLACCTHSTILVLDSRTGKLIHAIGGAE
jgi:WD40 repeat protein